MKPSGLLLALSAAASVTFLLATTLTISDWPVVYKVASILLLAVLGFRVDALLGTALAICSLGDVLLGIRQLGSLNAESLFLLGLGSFLVGHLVYIAMFRSYRGDSISRSQRKLPLKQGRLEWGTQLQSQLNQRRLEWGTRTLGIAVVLIALGSVLGVLRNSLGPLLIPVVVYALVLAGMGISAMLAELGNPLASVGALSFIASDAMLAVNKFRAPFPCHEPLIWITYYAAQLLILLGVEQHRQRRCPPANKDSGIEQK